MKTAALVNPNPNSLDVERRQMIPSNLLRTFAHRLLGTAELGLWYSFVVLPGTRFLGS
jgi:hypothetical protein